MMIDFNDTEFTYELEENSDDEDVEGRRVEGLDPNLDPVDFRTKLQEYMLNWLGY